MLFCRGALTWYPIRDSVTCKGPISGTPRSYVREMQNFPPHLALIFAPLSNKPLITMHTTTITKSFAINDSSARFDIIEVKCLNGYINILGKKIINDWIKTIDRQAFKQSEKDCYSQIHRHLRDSVSAYYTADILTFLEMKVGLRHQ